MKVLAFLRIACIKRRNEKETEELQRRKRDSRQGNEKDAKYQAGATDFSSEKWPLFSFSLSLFLSLSMSEVDRQRVANFY